MELLLGLTGLVTPQLSVFASPATFNCVWILLSGFNMAVGFRVASWLAFAMEVLIFVASHTV
jgi:hypothetical protein